MISNRLTQTDGLTATAIPHTNLTSYLVCHLMYWSYWSSNHSNTLILNHSDANYIIIIIIKGQRQRHTEGAEAQLHQFLTSALDRTGSQLHALANLLPGTSW